MRLYAYGFLSILKKQYLLFGFNTICVIGIFHYCSQKKVVLGSRSRFNGETKKARAFDEVSKQQEFGDELYKLVFFIILPFFENITSLPYHRSVKHTKRDKINI